jgi:hypothetical protein
MSLHGRFLNGCAGFFLARLRPTRASFGRPSSRRGLPQITRKDNASPFAGHGAGGLSRLSFPGRDAARSFSGPASPGKTATMTTRHRTLERKRRKGRNSRAASRSFRSRQRLRNHRRGREAWAWPCQPAWNQR